MEVSSAVEPWLSQFWSSAFKGPNLAVRSDEIVARIALDLRGFMRGSQFEELPSFFNRLHVPKLTRDEVDVV